MFQPGISGNPRGRPRGSLSGRAQVLAVLDRILSQECNQQVIFDALEKELPADPSRFFRNTVVPLIPRAALDAPASDALDDGQPLDRHPQSTPTPVPPVPSVPSIPPPSALPPPSVPPSSSILSLTCYLLLLIPFALKPAVLLPTARPLQTLTLSHAHTSHTLTAAPSYSQPRVHIKHSNVSHARSGPVLPLLFVGINSARRETNAKHTETLDR